MDTILNPFFTFASMVVPSNDFFIGNDSPTQYRLFDAGYRLDREADGLRALISIERQRWDLVLLDLMLPGADRWAVCRHLRELHAGVPVIMLSAHSAEAHRVLGRELGADDYMAKPFSMLEPVARVRALLRRVEQTRARPGIGRAFRFVPFRLDTDRRALVRSKVPVPLTLREFDLLHFMVRHPGRAFGRAELPQRVWGAGFDGFEHIVDSHINRLRTKVEEDARTPRRIVTVWGVGYRFEPEAAA